MAQLQETTSEATDRVVELKKSDRTRLRCLEAAIAIAADRGLGDLTWESLAQTASISRPLVKRYFNSKPNLILECAKIARREYQLVLISAMAKHDSPQAKFTAYIRKMIEMPRLAPEGSGLLLCFYHYCRVDRTCREANAEFVKMGNERIAALLQACPLESGEFLSATQALELGRTVQIFLTGVITSFLTEDDSHRVIKKEKAGADEIFKLVTAAGVAGVPSF